MVNAAQVEMSGEAAGHVTPKQNVNSRAPSLKGKNGTSPYFCRQYTWRTFVSKVAIH